MLYQEQPDGTGRISNGCNRDGSRAPHWCITGGLHPRSSVTLRLATTGHAARVPPAPHQCRAAGFRRAPQVATRGTGRTPQPPPPPHVGQQSKTARYLANILSSSFREVRSRRYRKSSCSSSSALSTARSRLTLAGAADATPAAGHSSLREMPNTLLIASESRAAPPLSLSKRESDHFIRRGKPRCVPTAVELLRCVESSHVAGLPPSTRCSVNSHVSVGPSTAW